VRWEGLEPLQPQTASIRAPPSPPKNWKRKKRERGWRKGVPPCLSLRDRLGEPKRGGSEWQQIKILLEGDDNSNKMNTTSKTRLRLNYPNWPRPRIHWSATSPRNQQPPSRTRERSGTTTWALLTYTGQVGEHHRLDRSLLAKPKNFHRRPLHQSGRCSSPVRPV
jgi:hypothetical protein